MRSSRSTGRRVAGAITAASVLIGLAAATPRASASPRSELQRAAPGTQLWASNYDSVAGSYGFGASAAVSPDGSTVYVTGPSTAGVAQPAYDFDYATVAYNAVTGAQLWVSRDSGPAKGQNFPAKVAVSPDGHTVFVTGASAGIGTGFDYATVAYKATTGTQLWASRYDGPGHGDDHAWSMAVSPDGGTVYITGGSPGATSNNDYATIAYRAATGAQLWIRRYNGPGNGKDSAVSIAVAPHGHRVFVTGGSTGKTTGFDYATIAYGAATGRQIWLRRYDGPAHIKDYGHSVTVSRDGKEVIVTGASRGVSTGVDYATIGYSAGTGRQLWVARYNGPGNNTDDALSVVAGLNGQVFVSGYSRGTTSGQDYATIAYQETTGAKLWVARYNGPANVNDLMTSMAIGVGGRNVYVTGFTEAPGVYSYATVAYSTASGKQLWARRYRGGSRNLAEFVAVGPAGSPVVVTGLNGIGFGTVAYQG
jgi:hypothetical protein